MGRRGFFLAAARPLLSAWLLLLALLGGAGSASGEPVEIVASPILGFRIASAEREFGPLRFIGGLVLRSDEKRFGGYSGIRFFADRVHFLAVSDAGTWLGGELIRDAAGIPSRIEHGQIGPLVAGDAGFIARKLDADCEAIELDGDRAWLAFERRHRIATLALADHLPTATPQAASFDLKRLKLSGNKGIETIALFPQASPRAGALLAISEASLNGDGNIRAFVLEGEAVGEFAIRRSDDFDITDGDFLPGGDLLVLERRFSFKQGPAMRLRRIPAGELAEGNLATGTVLLTADSAYRIDNMEGLDVSTADDGAVHVTLLSDDNFSLLQHTLLLEFRLAE